MHTYVHMCVFACVRPGMCVCMYVFGHVCVHTKVDTTAVAYIPCVFELACLFSSQMLLVAVGLIEQTRITTAMLRSRYELAM